MDKMMIELSKPFHVRHVTWKPGATTKDKQKCLAMPYADLRAYQSRLDEVCGMNWGCTFQPWDGRIICQLTIAGVTRSSTGESDSGDANAGTSAEAQAFKRACVAFGLGRYLYELPSPWVAYDGEKRRIPDAAEEELRARYRTWYDRKMAAMPGQADDDNE